MRSKKALLNTVVQVILEIVTVISGFIIPRMIISTYGSSANGLVVSISQFFGYLTILQSGIGGVAKAALYKPLADNDNKKINSLVKAIESFFKKIGYISIVYLIVLLFVFPNLIYPTGNMIDTAVLVFIIWLGIFAQYYFGMTYQFLLQADQRYYIYSITQIGVVIVNTFTTVLLIRSGVSLQLVKLASSIVFVIRPVLLSVYCKKKYRLSSKTVADNSLIKQRWDGFGHTIAYFIHSKTDVFILTLFTTLTDVSIYSVYASVASGLSLLLNTVATSVQSAFGNMIAREEKNTLNNNFRSYVCANNTLVMVLFSTAIITIIPFMNLYTKGFNNLKYISPTFGSLLLMAEAAYCVRMPYQTIVLAAGHYKQTRNGAFAEAAINIAISLILVHRFGIIGVTIGTLSAMIFRTIQYILYLSENIINQKTHLDFFYMVLDFIILVLSWIFSLIISKISIVSDISSYTKWGIFALVVFLLQLIIICPIIRIIDPSSFNNVISIFKRAISRKE